MAKDIFSLAAYARENYQSPEYNAFFVKTYEEALNHNVLKDYAPQPWWFERLQYLDEGRVKTQETKDGIDVELADIVGTTHNFFDEQYAGHTWLEMLVLLKKRETPPNNAEEAKNAILPNKQKGLVLYQLNKKYYIAEGNHRVIYAKFLFNNNGTWKSLGQIHVSPGSNE